METLHTPGGTGALRVAADLVARIRPGATVWVSHAHVAQPSPGVRGGRPDHEGVPVPGRRPRASWTRRGCSRRCGARRPGDVVLLHACCHNPTGIDPTADVWRAIGDVIAERGLLPLVDFAYQGFGDGLEEDGAGLRELVRPGAELLVASSFSKNFSLYDERVGALSLVGATAGGRDRAAVARQGRGARELLQPAGARR